MTQSHGSSAFPDQKGGKDSRVAEQAGHLRFIARLRQGQEFSLPKISMETEGVMKKANVAILVVLGLVNISLDTNAEAGRFHQRGQTDCTGCHMAEQSSDGNGVHAMGGDVPGENRAIRTCSTVRMPVPPA